jgi:Glycosyl transferase family 2
MSDCTASLTVSIVTTSFNQAAFLETAMRSVLAQDIPSLEYVVVDGGSTDESPDLIRRHQDSLNWWVSESDRGYADALNKGFAHTTGEIMGWLNSDDQYAPWTLSVVREIFEQFPQIEWLTSARPLLWDSRGRAVHCPAFRGFSREGFMRGEHLPRPGYFAVDYIQQESTFWRRTLWDRTGGRIETELRQAGDFELWMRFFQHAPLYAVETPLGGWRYHGAQLTGSGHEKYSGEAEMVLERAGGSRYTPPHQLWRRLCYQCCPVALQPWAAKLGGLYPANVVRFHAREGGWRIVPVFV